MLSISNLFFTALFILGATGGSGFRHLRDSLKARKSDFLEVRNSNGKEPHSGYMELSTEWYPATYFFPEEVEDSLSQEVSRPPVQTNTDLASELESIKQEVNQIRDMMETLEESENTNPEEESKTVASQPQPHDVAQSDQTIESIRNKPSEEAAEGSAEADEAAEDERVQGEDVINRLTEDAENEVEKSMMNNPRLKRIIENRVKKQMEDSADKLLRSSRHGGKTTTEDIFRHGARSKALKKLEDIIEERENDSENNAHNEESEVGEVPSERESIDSEERVVQPGYKIVVVKNYGSENAPEHIIIPGIVDDTGRKELHNEFPPWSEDVVDHSPRKLKEESGLDNNKISKGDHTSGTDSAIDHVSVHEDGTEDDETEKTSTNESHKHKKREKLHKLGSKQEGPTEETGDMKGEEGNSETRDEKGSHRKKLNKTEGDEREASNHEKKKETEKDKETGPKINGNRTEHEDENKTEETNNSKSGGKHGSEDSKQKETEDTERTDVDDSEKNDADDSEKNDADDSEKNDADDSEKNDADDSEKNDADDSKKSETQDNDTKDTDDNEKSEKTESEEKETGESEKDEKEDPHEHKTDNAKTEGMRNESEDSDNENSNDFGTEDSGKEDAIGKSDENNINAEKLSDKEKSLEKDIEAKSDKHHEKHQKKSDNSKEEKSDRMLNLSSVGLISPINDERECNGTEGCPKSSNPQEGLDSDNVNNDGSNDGTKKNNAADNDPENNPDLKAKNENITAFFDEKKVSGKSINIIGRPYKRNNPRAFFPISYTQKAPTESVNNKDDESSSTNLHPRSDSNEQEMSDQELDKSSPVSEQSSIHESDPTLSSSKPGEPNAEDRTPQQVAYSTDTNSKDVDNTAKQIDPVPKTTTTAEVEAQTTVQHDHHLENEKIPVTSNGTQADVDESITKSGFTTKIRNLLSVFNSGSSKINSVEKPEKPEKPEKHHSKEAHHSKHSMFQWLYLFLGFPILFAALLLSLVFFI